MVLQSRLGETWEYNGISWVFTSDIGSCSYCKATYDLARGVTLWFDGAPHLPSRSTNAWEYDGISWSTTSVILPAGEGGPNARYRHRLSYDTSRKKTVLFGGTEDMYDSNSHTWE